MSFLERTGILKTERREAESVTLARAVIKREPLRAKNANRMMRLAKLNKVSVRAARLLDAPEQVEFDAKVSLEEIMSLYDMMSEEFAHAGIPFVVLKSFDSLPDIGHDLDLMIPPSDIDRAKALLLKRFGTKPLELTHCDKLLGKFSCYFPGFKQDFEIYPTISQLGENHVDPELILQNRTLTSINGREVWVMSYRDRVLIRIIHAMFRHNFLKLSDIVDFLNLAQNCTVNEIIDGIDNAGIGDAFMFFLESVDRFLKACDADRRLIETLKNESMKKFGKDRFGFFRNDRLVLPYRIPSLAIMLLFLLKGTRAGFKGKWRTSILCLAAPALLILDFLNHATGNRVVRQRIW
jgi:hypothetical protein